MTEGAPPPLTAFRRVLLRDRGEPYIVEAVEADGSEHLRLSLRRRPEGDLRRLRIPLEGSGELQPWVYRPPDDDADSAGMLLIFLDEEILTGAFGWARTRAGDGGLEFELAPYGLRRDDEAEHERLLDASGPFGWHGRGREPGAG